MNHLINLKSDKYDIWAFQRRVARIYTPSRNELSVCVKIMKKRPKYDFFHICFILKYRFRLQKGVKNQIRHRIRIRDPKNVGTYISSFPTKMTTTPSLRATWGGRNRRFSPPGSTTDILAAYFVVRRLISCSSPYKNHLGPI